MKLRILSDLHLESDPNYKIPEMVDDHEQVLILAGDTVPFHMFERKEYSKFIKQTCKRFRHVIYVPGNHEYYHGDIMLSEENFLKFVSGKNLKNLIYLNKGTVEIDGKLIIGACLWTDMNKGDPITMALNYKGMNDFFTIKNGKFRLTPEVIRSTHLNHLSYLKDNIKKGCVVVTHHAPSYKSMHECYHGSPLNPFFYSELDSFILDNEPKLWIHGHTHSSFDYKIGETHIICNPKGYKEFYNMSNENPYYDEFKLVEV